jgi:hypothetical protein
VTANLRIAPTAMRRIEVPMPMRPGVPARLRFGAWTAR